MNGAIKDAAHIYRNQIVRAVMGRPAEGAKIANAHELNRICLHLAENEDALSVLVAKGYGGPDMSLVEAIRALPNAPKGK
jgi:hypothetical protein